MTAMKKILTIAVLALLACTAKAKGPVINIRTDNVSMIIRVEQDGRLNTLHFGGAIEDASAFSDFKSGIHGNHGAPYDTYPTQGWRGFNEPALAITHKNGDLNTELRYLSHETRTLTDNNITETTIHLADKARRGSRSGLYCV